jgi:hypothetical protein
MLLIADPLLMAFSHRLAFCAAAAVALMARQPALNTLLLQQALINP